jgi:hypothetical protein
VAEINDGYDAYYAERLWQLLPAVYRTADSVSLDDSGPLRELVNRIGAQVAVVRRSIDRLWADQSIETCDNWVIPYIGDLLGANLVDLDPVGQRRDVFKTIHYRRRKGTVENLEELAADVTGWTAHVVEGFRRLARTRHGLDPAVGAAAFGQAGAADLSGLLQAEGLAGLLTGGLAGGFADLRSGHGTALAGTPFDESFHLADVRSGQGAVGHFGIPKLLVFLWRLSRFQIVEGTPVAVAGCPGQYVFDPTGREIPLFLPPPPPGTSDFSLNWTPALEWQVPGPLTSSLESAIMASTLSPPPPQPPPYPGAAAVPPLYRLNGAQLDAAWPQPSVWPEIGRFAAAGPPTEPFTVNYQYGFSGTVGAGPFDRSQLANPPTVISPETVVTGGTGLDTALTARGATGTVTIGNADAAQSPTYPALADAGPVTALLVRAGPQMRPVLRPPADAGPWIFTAGDDGQLILDGLTLAGCDLVLRGSFDTVRITACTIDPGTAAAGTGAADTGADGSPPLLTAADGVPLAPCRIFIEAGTAAGSDPAGPIGQLLVDHCILGPIRTRFGGSVQTLTITDSIVQGLPATTGSPYTAADIFDPVLFAQALLSTDPVAVALLAAMQTAAPTAVTALRSYAAESRPTQESGLPELVIDGLNALVGGASLYDPALFATVNLSAAVRALAAQATALAAQGATLDPADLAALNRGLIDESFPVALGVAALAVADATVTLDRVTVLGRTAVHQLSACDSILRDFAAVDDTQDGGVRFSAYADGSAIPRPYESAVIPAGAPIFTSDQYGQPGYGQLLEIADAAIVGGAAGASISSGAGNNSEMGAFCADLNPVKEQGLLLKYAEYLPLGLTPVIIHVT